MQAPKKSQIDTLLDQARDNTLFPLPHQELIYFADMFYNLKGDPNFVFQVPEAVKWRILQAAEAYKNERGVIQMGTSFGTVYLSPEELVVLYRIIHAYVSEDRYKTTGRGIFHFHLYLIENHLHQMCEENPEQKSKAIAALKDQKDSSLRPLTEALDCEDLTFIQMRKVFCSWCEERSRSPEYLERIIKMVHLQEDLLKKSSSKEELDRVREKVVALTKEIDALTQGSQTRERKLGFLEIANTNLAESLGESERQLSLYERALDEASSTYKKDQEAIARLRQQIAKLGNEHKREKERLTQSMEGLTKRVQLLELGGQREAVQEILDTERRVEDLVDQLVRERANLSGAATIKTKTIGGLTETLSDLSQIVVPAQRAKREALRRMESLKKRTDKTAFEHQSRYESMRIIVTEMNKTLSATQQYVRALEEQIRKLGHEPVSFEQFRSSPDHEAVMEALLDQVNGVVTSQTELR